MPSTTFRRRLVTSSPYDPDTMNASGAPSAAAATRRAAANADARAGSMRSGGTSTGAPNARASRIAHR